MNPWISEYRSNPWRVGKYALGLEGTIISSRDRKLTKPPNHRICQAQYVQIVVYLIDP